MLLRFSMLAVAFFLSCSEVERSNIYDERSINFIAPQIVYGTPVFYDGENYQTVVIGTQTWMARNLNYNASGSKCYACDEYGRLYDWTTAMALPDSCNASFCYSQISEKHRGICPEGWHIPNDADWDKLLRYADGTSGSESPYDSETAGRYLKAKSGWNYYGGGTDTYGFSALSVGGGRADGSFDGVGDYGVWWSSSETDAENAYIRSMDYDHEFVRYYGDRKYILFSVRCLQD